MRDWRVLITGARNWTDEEALFHALSGEAGSAEIRSYRPVLVHGGADGVDRMASLLWVDWGHSVDCYPAHMFGDPKERNEYMVSLGADVCLAFANRWDSGTGHCARAARRAGIPTIDCGVITE